MKLNSRFELAEKSLFQTEIPVLVNQINYGGHLGNDSLLSLLQEARIQFLHHHGLSEQGLDGVGIIMIEAQVRYLSQARWGEILGIDIGLSGCSRSRVNLSYRVTHSASGVAVAEAVTQFAFFDYGRQKPVPMPRSFQRLFKI